MDIFSILTLCGGLAFFLYGMLTMSKSLEKMAGGKLERTIRKMTVSIWRGLLLGAGVTIAIQSSSAVTVMLVGLVNSGVMNLGQTIGIIMGSNIGTTLTAWILSLAGIESDNAFINLLKPENFSPVLALLGILLIMGSKKQRRREIGRVLIGFSILMYGMELMKDAAAPLTDMPSFQTMLSAFSNPLLGVLAGAVMTAVLQSSSASIGILQALALTGNISYGVAVPIIMGQNIGTCVTAILSSFGVGRNAKRVAMLHILFNVIGTAAGLALFCGGNLLFHFPVAGQSASAAGIAFCHTAFNVATTLLLLPFARQLVRLAKALVRNEEPPKGYAFLDPLLLRTPGAALNECISMAHKMARLSQDNLLLVLEQFRHYDTARESVIAENEDKLDTCEDRLGNYLARLAQHGISQPDMRTVSLLLRTIGDFERIGDYAWELQEKAKEFQDGKLLFSQNARAELDILESALHEIVQKTMQCFLTGDVSLANQTEPLEEAIRQLSAEIRTRHIGRLEKGLCTIQMGLLLNDMLTHFERIADHCSNVAVSVIEAAGKTAGSHRYLQALRKGETFTAGFRAALERYQLPELSEQQGQA